MEQLQLCVSLKVQKSEPEVLQEIERIEEILRRANGEEEERFADIPDEQYEEYEEQVEEDDGGYASEERFSATLRYPKRDTDASFFGGEEEYEEDIPQHHIEQYYVSGHSVDIGDQTPPPPIHGALWATDSR